jgi:hypothetical protein
MRGRRSIVAGTLPGVLASLVIPGGLAASLFGCMPRPSVPVAAVAIPASVRSPTPPRADERSIRPYTSIITRDAKTRRGMFITHRVGDKLYFEIPKRELDVDMLIVGRYARASANSWSSFGGDEFVERTVRWDKVGHRILLRATSYTATADSTLPVYRAVQAGNFEPIIASFDVMTYGPDSAAVIDATRLFTTGVPELTAMRGGVDATRSYVDRVASFPANVEIEAVQTGSADRVQLPNGTAIMQGSVRSVLAHWSMIHLPDKPLTPRTYDERMGYFTVSRNDFGAPTGSIEQQYITRWRLEKKDPSAAVSEPVKPIVYYIDPATPDEWKPWIRKAILDWQPAFEAAGFKNAIVAADAPQNDPDWSPEDVRYTMIRWLPSLEENAQGPHIADPRTGEILNGSIRVFHNIMKLQRDWYFMQAGPLDPRAQRWPMPDSLMGRLLQYVVSHEIGHTLGLRHNQLGSSLYPADSLRSKRWLHTMGHSPSIMDYARFNYVAQPEDNIPPEDLLPRIGPYDHFAIQWGYTPIPAARTSDDETGTLNRWLAAQDTVTWLRFAERNYQGGDYGTMTEVIGDENPVFAARMGLKNLERVFKMLPQVAATDSTSRADAVGLYYRAVQQWQTEIMAVVSVLGGSTIHPKSGYQPGPVFQPIPRERQVAAMKFLAENVFVTPPYLLDTPFSRRIEAGGVTDRITSMQSSVLASLLSDGRVSRIVEYSTASDLPTKESYRLSEYLRDIRRAIWSELRDRRVTITQTRKRLQGVYVDLLDGNINVRPSMFYSSEGYPGYWRLPQGPADIRSLMRVEMETLQKDVASALHRTRDPETRAYLRTVQIDIKRALDPKS